MSEEEIVNGNKIIAEFDGCEKCISHTDNGVTTGYIVKGKVNIGNSPTDGYNNFAISQLEFHSSFDWLMPVCKKWSELEFDGKDQTWEYGFYSVNLSILVGKYEILPVFNQLVKNIEWYNQIKSK
jgi:hypothetical protein